jgi:valyl-tRNA synthetase
MVAGGAKTGLLKEQAAVITTLAGLDPAQFDIHQTLPSKPEDALALVIGQVEMYIPLSGMVDRDEERIRLEKELSDIRIQVERLEKLLASDFASKAPAPVVQKEREKLAEYQQTAEKLRAQLA